MAGFTPQLPYNTPMYLLVPVYKQIKGVKKKFTRKSQESCFSMHPLKLMEGQKGNLTGFIW